MSPNYVLLEKMYSEAAASLLEILSLADSIDDESYVTETVHFFTDWVVRSAILQTRSIPERHTVENMNFSFQIFI